MGVGRVGKVVLHIITLTVLDRKEIHIISLMFMFYLFFFQLSDGEMTADE